MNRVLFGLAFAIGLVAVVWVGVGFVGTSWLALFMTALIAIVYALGAVELRQFRAATSALAKALAEAPSSPTELGTWLEGVPASVRQAVRLRIEGERVGLPGPALTPYLVGLLVMLGMLGTFLGMVVTFKGAVFALEGSTDLNAIRAALAAPIKGLGMSFGTSVAGVASSAMLGLMSAMSRRERIDVVRLLDTCIATVFKPFSLAHQRQETYKALQAQTHALPAVVDKLQAMMEGMERRSQDLNAQLLGQQAQFHRDSAAVYTSLAADVGQSLKDSLSASTRAASEGLQPVVESAMTAIAQESALAHLRLLETADEQMSGLSARFEDTARNVSDGWATALETHARTSDSLVDGLGRSLSAFTQTFEERAGTLLTAVNDKLTSAHAAQASADGQRLAAWTQQLAAQSASLQTEWQRLGTQTLDQQQAVSLALERAASEISERSSAQTSQVLEGMSRLLGQSEELVRSRTEAEAQWQRQQGDRMDQLAVVWRAELGALRADEATRGQAAVERLGELQSTLAGHLSTVNEALATSQSAHATADEQRLQAWAQKLEAMAATLHGEWQRVGAQTLDQQQAVCLALEKTASEITHRVSDQASRTLDDITRLLNQSETLLRSRLDAEADWARQQGARMDQLAGLWRTELGALRDDEAARGQAAVARLGELQAALATQLATLGTALEAPMTRLMQTASDVPQAAAEVMVQLRHEMTQLTERDKLALQEREALMDQVRVLLQTINQASSEQRAAITSLTSSAVMVLTQAGQQHADKLADQASQAAEVAAHVSGSAIELASLGESFTHGIGLFNAGNEKLMDSLARIEAALKQSMARSDEQLAYYVAQAREVIDLSISSQQGIVEDLRRLHGKQTARAEGAAG
jgi:hypothetical protein